MDSVNFKTVKANFQHQLSTPAKRNFLFITHKLQQIFSSLRDTGITKNNSSNNTMKNTYSYQVRLDGLPRFEFVSSEFEVPAAYKVPSGNWMLQVITSCSYRRGRSSWSRQSVHEKIRTILIKIPRSIFV